MLSLSHKILIKYSGVCVCNVIKCERLWEVNSFTRHLYAMLWKPWLFLKASELLRKMCMQNMVWSYCKKISSEWKHQVRNVTSQNLRFRIYTLYLLLFEFASLFISGLYIIRWSRKWLQASSSRTRRTTTHRVFPSCLLAQDSVRLQRSDDANFYPVFNLILLFLLLLRWRGYQPQSNTSSGQWEDEG